MTFKAPGEILTKTLKNMLKGNINLRSMY